jgi:hypothetical protein
MAEVDDRDEVTALSWAPYGLFVVGHVSGKLRGWRLPEPGDTTSEEGEEEAKEE